MNKFGTLVFLFVLLLCIGNVYSIDHSLGGDLEIKQSVVDKMKKEKFTYSYKELKNKKKIVRQKYGKYKGTVINALNKIEKSVEYMKTTIETALDNADKKKLMIYSLVGLFILWYVRRVIKNSFLNKRKVNIYFKESGKNKKYQDLSYPYFDNATYLSSNNDNSQYLNSYNSVSNASAQPAQKKFSLKSSGLFSQRKRKNSDDGNNNTNLFTYAYV
ncbi:hypothetical protein BCR36DRAFT_584353 [Piromyces finnis]|uniref:Uncharacterized protein n=1 Tax=Piromyces finnis TaxID=1754191 RepID=A0A1Y1V6M6_9FUNG|nr:hypothetical protein BCR36DRAFT_584353 [Piromyces finnis]|eukprot:ORX48440.1 hypothetical protein BCR36DRAFT_584353 [Piromyces finnis]